MTSSLDWRSARGELIAAAKDGDGVTVRSGLRRLLDAEQSPRVFTLGAKLAASLAQSETLTSLSVLILRSFTVEPLVNSLITNALVRGLLLDVSVAEFDQFEQVLISEEPTPQPNVLLLWALAGDHEPGLGSRFSSMSEESAEALVQGASQRGEGWLVSARSKFPNSEVLLAGCMLPRFSAFGLAEAGLALGHREAIERTNASLRDACRRHSGATFFDVESVISEVGRARALDARMWAHARQPFSATALGALSESLARHLAALRLPRRKCIVLDCDNTLWGGVVGEDGIDGIALGPEHPGSSFVAFQESLRSLFDRGILLALASKNNEGDVLEVLRSHRHQVLREEHIAAHVIGWGDKASSIEQLAARLNIGIDSMVFIDDSDYECALVRERLPEVEVVQAPSDPLALADMVQQLESLDAVTISSTDRTRGAMYKAQAARNVAQADAPSLDVFLSSLGLEIEIRPVASAAEIERAAQLCQRTNQLNVTTRRHQVADIERMVSSPAFSVLQVELRDRFGDHGICGLAISEHQGDDVHIETLLLSCRVIGRGVEDALAIELENRAREHGGQRLFAEFIATKKNAPARELFDRLGFERLDAAAEQAERTGYLKLVASEPRRYPEWFKVEE